MAVAARITSRQHASVRRCRRAAQGEPGVVLLDGAHLVQEALDAGVALDLLLSDGHWSDLEARAGRAGAEIFIASRAVLDAASPVRTPTGIVAVARWQPAGAVAALEGALPCALGLVGVQDPGNVGSAIRAADALGATGVLALEDTADPAGWKALRGAMGSTFHLPVARASLAETMEHARRRRIAVAAAVAANGTPIEATDLGGPILLLVGNEGGGLPPELIEGADVRVTIPMRSGAESLNVAVTSALLLYEARRQRGAPAHP